MSRGRSIFGFVAIMALGMVLAPILLVALACFGFLSSDAVSAPPGWETAIGERALDGSLDRRAAGLANPIPQGDEAALLAGMELYSDNCAGCHGGARGPSQWGSGGFYPRVPQFWQELGRHVAPAEAFVAIRDGIRYSGMGAWRGMMSEPEMWQVANFVSRMHALPPNVDARWRAPPDAQ